MPVSNFLFNSKLIKSTSNAQTATKWSSNAITITVAGTHLKKQAYSEKTCKSYVASHKQPIKVTKLEHKCNKAKIHPTIFF